MRAWIIKWVDVENLPVNPSSLLHSFLVASSYTNSTPSDFLSSPFILIYIKPFPTFQQLTKRESICRQRWLRMAQLQLRQQRAARYQQRRRLPIPCRLISTTRPLCLGSHCWWSSTLRRRRRRLPARQTSLLPWAVRFGGRWRWRGLTLKMLGSRLRSPETGTRFTPRFIRFVPASEFRRSSSPLPSPFLDG